MTAREEFIKKIQATFKIEAAEGISNITKNLMELESSPFPSRESELVESIYRDAHSLKGAARAVNIPEIETICQAIETVFSALKNKKLVLDPKLFDLFHHTVNILTQVLNSEATSLDEHIIDQVAEITLTLLKVEEGKPDDVVFLPPSQNENLQTNTESRPGVSNEPESIQPLEDIEPKKKIPVPTKSDNTIRISIDKLDKLLFQAEEMLALKQSFSHFSEGIDTAVKKLNSWSNESKEVLPLLNQSRKFIERQTHDLERNNGEGELLKVFDFLDWTASFMKGMNADFRQIRKQSVQEAYESGVKIESLLTDVKKMISIPFSSILDGFPKAARDISRDNGKDVVMIITGDDLEIDRRILEEIRNPLMHLMRNCVDHGIEKPFIRKQENKPSKGVIQLSIDRLENNKVEIIISDDGAGIDLEKVKAKYIKQEKIPHEEIHAISEQILYNYLFRSGVSTSEIITDLSGRGLGLAIVREKIENLGGSVQVSSFVRKGTTFRIELPLSLVTFRGVRILVGQREFIAPTSKIDRVLRLNISEIKNVKSKATIPYNDNFIPLVKMSDILEIPVDAQDEEMLMIMVFASGNHRIAFVVNEILNEEVILVKKFNSQLKRVRNISGATVLGSGKVVPILNVADLLKSASKEQSFTIEKSDSRLETTKKSILVVEDSITSRMLLKNILDTAGYNVTTAIDGIDGYTKLKEEEFDLVVSDVDMPRLSGFDMTAKIRSEKSLAEIPIVLVTSLSKREDKERGMEVGANAYIIKSSFDQSNLLEVIERLLD